MTIYYSKSKNGFFHSEINKGIIPDDAVEITETQHKELLEGNAQGQLIVADEEDKPYLLDPNSLPKTEDGIFTQKFDPASSSIIDKTADEIEQERSAILDKLVKEAEELLFRSNYPFLLDNQDSFTASELVGIKTWRENLRKVVNRTLKEIPEKPDWFRLNQA